MKDPKHDNIVPPKHSDHLDRPTKPGTQPTPLGDINSPGRDEPPPQDPPPTDPGDINSPGKGTGG